MKSFLFYLLCLLMCIIICTHSKAQGTSAPADTSKISKIVMPPDSISIVSLRDYTIFFTWLQENISKAAYDKLTPEQVLSNFAQWAIYRWSEEKKKKPKP